MDEAASSGRGESGSSPRRSERQRAPAGIEEAAVAPPALSSDRKRSYAVGPGAPMGKLYSRGHPSPFRGTRGPLTRVNCCMPLNPTSHGPLGDEVVVDDTPIAKAGAIGPLIAVAAERRGADSP